MMDNNPPRGDTPSLDEATLNMMSDSARDLLIRQATSGRDPGVRRYALFMLGNLHDPGLSYLFIALLKDPDKTVRAQAAVAIAGTGKDALPRIVPLLNDPDWKTRYRAAESLGLIRDPLACQSLLAALDDEKDHVRYMAAKGLGEIGGIEAVKPLIRALFDENEFVRRISATSLGKIGGKEASDALHNAYRREKDRGVREAIAAALTKPRS